MDIWHPTMQMVDELTEVRQHTPARYSRNEVWNGIAIITGVLLVVMVAVLPQFVWFQNLTGISSWIEFLRNLFGAFDGIRFLKNLAGMR